MLGVRPGAGVGPSVHSSLGRVGRHVPEGYGVRQLTVAIIFVPPGRDASVWLRVCAEHCTSRGYRVAAVVSDWADVVRMLQDGGIEVVVVGHRDQLPADRPWRVEAVEESRPADPPERRRPSRR